MKLLKASLIAIAALTLGGCVSGPEYRYVPANTQVIYVREYPYYAPVYWHIGIGHRHHHRR
jgi:hypothetical protein